MIIERLDLIAYGRFNKRSLDLSSGPRRFHLIYGANESGKSTSLRAISDWLFGFSGTPIDDYIVPMRSLRIGGLVTNPETSTAIECIRRKGNKDTLLEADGKTVFDEEVFNGLLGGIDLETFVQQFGISHRQLVEGGQQILDGKGDMGEILFAAGAGLSRLQKQREDLKKRRGELYTDRKSSSPSIYQSMAQWEALKQQLAEASVPSAVYLTLCQDLEALRASEKSATERLKAASHRADRLKAISRAKGWFIERRSLLQRLDVVKDAVQLSPSFGSTYRDLGKSRSQAQNRLRQIELELAGLNEQMTGLPVDENWIAHEAIIERLHRNGSTFEQDRTTLERKQVELEQVKRQLEDVAMRLTSQDNANELDGTTISLADRANIMTLANQHSGVMQQKNNASSELQRKRELLRRYQEDVGSDEEPASAQFLTSALRGVGNPQILITSHARSIELVEVAEAKVKQALGRLKGFHGSLQESISLQVPAEASLAKAVDTIDQARSKRSLLEASLEQTDKKIEELRRRMDEAATQTALPDADQVERVRHRRNELLAALIEASVESRSFATKDAIELRDGVMEIEQANQRFHDHHDLVLRREQERRELEVTEKTRVKQASMLAEATEAFDTATERWRSMWTAIGIVPDDVESMRGWESEHRQLLQLAADLAERTAEQRSAARAIEQARTTLCEALRLSRKSSEVEPAFIAPAGESTLFDSLDNHDDLLANDGLDDQSLVTLFAFAEREQESLSNRLTQHELKVARLASATEELEEAQAAEGSAKKAHEEWEAAWTQAITPLRSLGSVLPSSVDTLLHAVDELNRHRKSVEQLELQIASLSKSQGSFIEEVRSVATKCYQVPASGLEDRFESDLVADLSAKLRKFISNRERSDFLKQKSEELRTQSSAILIDLEHFNDDIAKLCKEAKCSSYDELASCEEASNERRQASDGLRAIENQLQLLADEQSLDEFEQEASQHAMSGIEEEIADADAEIQSVNAELRHLNQQIGELQAKVKQMDGSERASVILQEQQNLLARMRREVEQYAKLTIAHDLLGKAIEHYRSQSEGAVLDRASTWFSRMTCDHYQSLRVDTSEEKPVLFAVRQDGDVPANRLSDGTADALYLAMRIASLEVHLRSHTRIPLIVDDCLIQFDDDRAAAALSCLSELSEQTQVILFTHHQHLVDLARESLDEGQFHLHEL